MRKYNLSEAGRKARAKTNADPAKAKKISEAMQAMYQARRDDPMWHNRSIKSWQTRRLNAEMAQ